MNPSRLICVFDLNFGVELAENNTSLALQIDHIFTLHVGRCGEQLFSLPLICIVFSKIIVSSKNMELGFKET